MTSNNKVSSFFLLILIGLAIYYLINRDGLTNNVQEDFGDASASEEIVENVGNQSMESYVVDQPQMSNSEIKYEVSQEPYVSQSVINDIAVSALPDVIQPQTNTSIYNFQPNDESELGVNGSSLNDAFALPMQSGSQTDTIDFKKQNVDNYNARDFLPKEVNDEWFETDFSLAKYQLNDDKLINTEKYIIGVNTVGNSKRSASWDIRGAIPNPKFTVSPWNNSTYEPDFNLKPLC